MSDQQSDSHESRQSFFAKQQLVNSSRAAFQQLAVVLRNATLYPEAHPFLLSSAEKFLGGIAELMVGRSEVSFYLVAGELFFETLSIPLDENLSLLIEQFASREMGGLSFKPGLTQMEVISFAGLMSKGPDVFTEKEDLNEAIGKVNIAHIELHRALIVDRKADKAEIKEGKKPVGKIFADAISMVKELVQAVHLEKTVNMRKMNATVQTMVDNILENRDAFMGLTSIKMYDEYTFAHSVNVSVLAISLGTFLSFEKPQIAALGVAGLLHDIGKVNVPLDIINKPDKLTPEEWDQMKRHPVEGALILSDIPGVNKLAMVTAFEHHQHGDAKDYPAVHEGQEQHIFSKIVSLCDAYDAITATRVYYSIQRPVDEGIRILLKMRGKTFDPILVKAFVNMIGIFPVGTLLKLDTGEIGMVMHQTRDLMRPRVLLLDKLDGSEKETGAEISLLETANGRHKRSIVGTINPVEAKINVKDYLD
jgi:HD-GYP domain-containing protein (c-di-GMP phosphodiesterase class II)